MPKIPSSSKKSTHETEGLTLNIKEDYTLVPNSRDLIPTWLEWEQTPIQQLTLATHTPQHLKEFSQLVPREGGRRHRAEGGATSGRNLPGRSCG